MTKDEFQKTVDDVITDCIRNDYSFGSYARKVTDAVWPVLEAAEKERDVLRDRLALESQENGALRDSVDRACKERDELRAKIEAMEKQEPLYLFRRKGLDDFCTCSKERYEAFSANPRLFEVKTLYALPGAKGE